VSQAWILSLPQWLGYERDSSGFKFRQIQEVFIFPRTSRPTPELTHHLIQRVPRFFLGGGGEVDRLPPSSAALKNEWSHISAPPICLYGADSSLFDDINRSELIVLNCLGYIQAGDRSESREKCVKTSVYATRTPSLHAQTVVYTALCHTVYTSPNRISINEEPPPELKICCYKFVTLESTWQPVFVMFRHLRHWISRQRYTERYQTACRQWLSLQQISPVSQDAWSTTWSFSPQLSVSKFPGRKPSLCQYNVPTLLCIMKTLSILNAVK
jgi:hypothetical protein